MGKVLILYSTVDGHTREICLRLKRIIEQHEHQATLASLDDSTDMELGHFDRIVIGASIRYGKHRPLVADFINRNAKILEEKRGAFFSVNVVARKPKKNQPHTNPYLRRFLKKLTWKPRQLAVFAGKIDYPSYDCFDRMIIRMIMFITKGPTDPKAIVEFTDWRQVESFGRLIAEKTDIA